MAASPEGPPLYRPPTCLRPAVDVIGVRRSSFAAPPVGLERLIRPEVLSAPSDAEPTSRFAAAVATNSRGLSTESQSGIIVPQTTVIHPLPLSPQGLYRPDCNFMWGGGARSPSRRSRSFPSSRNSGKCLIAMSMYLQFALGCLLGTDYV